MTNALKPFDAQRIKWRDDALAAARRLSGAQGKLSAQQVQTLYDRALKGGPDDEHIMPAGFALGELIIERSGFQWMIAPGEYSDEPVVAGEAGILCAPVQMVWRRLKSGETADIDKLCNETVAAMREAIKAAKR